MKQQFMKTAFFDFDGVIVDTEPIYDIYWNEAGNAIRRESPISHPTSKERHYLIYWRSIFPTDLKNLRKR